MNGPCTTPLHVAQIGFFNDPQSRRPAQLLDAWPTVVDVAEATTRTGVRVSVLQACPHQQLLQRNGVDYHFLPFGDTTRISRGGTLGTLLSTLAPQVLHVHGLDFAPECRGLRDLLPRSPLILQDHASRLPSMWRRMRWRRGLSLAAGIAFCAKQQAQPFARAGLIAPPTQIYQIPESTSRFTPGDRASARLATGIYGDPALLWVGNLDSNKDPFTVLAGISAAAQALPGLQLWCCFGTAPLLRGVELRIAQDPNLRDRVVLLGRVPHQQIELLMRAADLFVLGSHREGSGYALIEALACGLPPVVTDIPSFHALTGTGAVARLWPCDDALALSAALQWMAPRASSLRAPVRAHFDTALSFDALGAKLAAMYRDVLDGARSLGHNGRRLALWKG